MQQATCRAVAAQMHSEPVGCVLKAALSVSRAIGQVAALLTDGKYEATEGQRRPAQLLNAAAQNMAASVIEILERGQDAACFFCTI